MSFRKLNAEVKALVKRVDLQSELISKMYVRLEKLEQRKKPGPKPKSKRDSGDSPSVSASAGNGTTKPETAAVQ